MAPSKPSLPPLKTPKTMPFPSELYDSPIKESPNSPKREGDDTASITPPAAYTEFLQALTPIFGNPKSAGEDFHKNIAERRGRSPVSRSSHTANVPFSSGKETKSSAALPSPSQTPQSAKPPGPLRRLRIPTLLYSPATCSPQSAYSVRSPYSPPEWRRRYLESPRSADEDTFSVRHVMTRTITYRVPPALNPPPKGKRRKTAGGNEHNI
ncbi:hypothetical protein PHISCL_03768 [Aspergillus sclerotialis]|uniref:Uncharacterized protein n=1 Tax=Aspergillus sclerotialis TaxID=2070753 RepID=A0A3A2ZX70_9EURO|nr:hypothetical protein PHISCL_03768 [Aspergillus sclerotialis]